MSDLFGVRLESRFINQTIFLGSTFRTKEEAQAYIDEEVCLRCNTASIIPVREDYVWVNRHEGFVDQRTRR